MKYISPSAAKHMRRQQGFVFELAMLALPMLLVIGAVALNSGRATLRKAQIQKISDQASHAGTVNLDLSAGGWERAREAAIQVLRLHAGELEGFEGIDFTSGGPEWSNGPLRVSIRRGQYRERRRQSSGFVQYSPGREQEFISHEPEDGNVPRFGRILANAVQVKLTYHEQRLMLPAFLNGSLSWQGFTIATDSLGVVDQTGGVQVPPLAIHLCALLNEKEELDLDAVCEADRLFASSRDASRFEQIDPAFLYDPGANSMLDAACWWNSPSYPLRRQNWGTIGLPLSEIGGSSRIEASDVRDTLELDQGLVPAVIGQKFRVLGELPDNARVNRSLGDELWGRISDRTLSNSAFHQNFADAFSFLGGALGSIQPNWVAYPRARWQQHCGCDPDDNDCFSPARQYVCGSRRFDWTGCGEGSERCDAREYTALPSPGKVWSVQIPVIFDVGSARTCAEMGPITAAGDYEIVGFVSALVYDTDIGLRHAPYQDFNEYMSIRLDAAGSAVLGTDWRAPAEGAQPPACLFGRANCGIRDDLEGTDARFDFGIFLPGERQTRPDEQPQPCNVVRARLACSLDFIADPNGESGTRKVRLVQ